MQKTKANGQAGPAIPAPAPPPVVAPPTPPPEPFDQIKSLIEQMGKKQYADGYRRATQLIARAVGRLDGEAKVRLSKVLDQLEEELHQATTAQ